MNSAHFPETDFELIYCMADGFQVILIDREVVIIQKQSGTEFRHLKQMTRLTPRPRKAESLALPR